MRAKTRLICAALALLMLFSGCTAQSVEPSVPTTLPTAPVTETIPPATESSANAQILAQRRDAVEAEMRHMMSMFWTPQEDIVYDLGGGKFITLVAGRIYRGMPYTHASGSGHGFLTYATGQDERGVYTISGLTGTSMSGDAAASRIGNNCADAVFWAWSTVCTSVRFIYTGQMTRAYGCQKVGDYTYTLSRYTSSTKPVTQKNGEQRMFQCYAQMQKGDAMVLYTDTAGGHAVMVADVHVEMNGDQIDGQHSYVEVLEQISSNLGKEAYYYDATLGEKVYLACGVDTVWSFNTLLSKGYLPVTCKELIDPAPLAEESVEDSLVEYSADTLCSGSIKASYPISHVTLIISDAAGNLVQQATCYPRESVNRYAFSVPTFLDPEEIPMIQGNWDPAQLSPGKYRCTLLCCLSTGNIHTVRDYEFTIE